jgi:hypothetical protein
MHGWLRWAASAWSSVSIATSILQALPNAGSMRRQKRGPFAGRPRSSRISRHRFSAEASQRGSRIECSDIYKEHLGANVETLVEQKKIKEPVVTDKPISRV